MKGDSQSSCIAKYGVRNITFLHQPHIRAFNFTLQKSFLKSQSPLPPLSLLCLQRTLQTAIVYWKDPQFQSKFSIIFSVTLISRIQGFHALIISMWYSRSRIQGFSCSHHLHVTLSFWNPRVFMAIIISPWNRTKNIITHFAARFSDFPQRNLITHLHHPCTSTHILLCNCKPTHQRTLNPYCSRWRTTTTTTTTTKINPCTQSIWASENRNSCSTKFVFVETLSEKKRGMEKQRKRRKKKARTKEQTNKSKGKQGKQATLIHVR